MNTQTPDTVISVQVVPVISEPGNVIAQLNGPTEHTTGWAVYRRLLDGRAMWVEDKDDEDTAMEAGRQLAAELGVEIEPQAWRT